jgi:uncharacterized protein
MESIMDKESIQKIILDYQAKDAENLTQRDLKIDFIPYMAAGITGVRRCGKTFRTHQLAKELSSKGLSENICRIQFNDHRLISIPSTELHLIDSAYYALFPEKRNSEEVYFIFDEIHRIKGWEDYILYLIESRSHKVIITGSTATLQRGEYASALRGKLFPYELSPFSFREFLRHYKIKENMKTTKECDLLLNYFRKYIVQGGFPGLLDIPENRQSEMLRTYWDAMILRDIIESHPEDNINVQLLRFFADSLVARTACPMTVNKLSENIQNAGLSFGKDTLYKFLAYLSDAYMIFPVEIYSVSEKVRSRNYKKIYCADWALARAVSYAESIDDTRAFENLIYLELKRRGYTINYYRTREEHEVDFVISRNGRIEGLVQACYSVDKPEVKNREFRALVKSAQFLKTDNLSVITVDDEGVEVIDGLTIKICPAWKWLLGK